MADAELLWTKDVILDDIRVSDRLRQYSESGVAAVMASIEELGHALKPVTVRLKGDKLVLIGGLHRLEAYRRLGRETIRADIWKCSDDWARLAEIDENLAGADLSTLEMARFLAQRKAVYEKLHPETKQGGDRGNQHTGGRQNDIVSFCQSMAEKRGISRRHAERLILIGRNIDIQAGVLLAAHEHETGRHISYGELANLATLKPYEQADAVKRYLAAPGERKLKAVIAEARTGKPEHPGLSESDAFTTRMMQLFGRAPKDHQRAFLRRLVEAHRGLIAETISELDGEEE